MNSANPSSPDETPPQAVAVIGLGCIMPDAPDPRAFWDNLVQGRLSIREVPPARWSPEDYYSPDRSQPEKTYSKIGSFVAPIEFDWRKYRIPPNVARHMDQNQKWAIMATDQCLSDSGYDRKEFDRQRTGVIIGNSGGGEIRIGNTMRIYYPAFRNALTQTPQFQTLSPAVQAELLADLEHRFKEPLQPTTEDTMPGELANVIAGRVANVFNLRGPNFSVDAACASNVAAFSAAMQYLRSGQLDMVVTGAVDASQNVAQFIKFAKIGALSETGCYPFDERADGFVMGEGCALFLLKRAEDAIRDGDKIHALILGIGASSDGRGKAITAPSVEGQVLAIERAWRDARLDPATVDYVECHGTGTRLGDHTELEALHKTYALHRNGHGPLFLGTVKANIGHLKSAAGAAGLLKTVLSLSRGQLAPTPGHERPLAPLRAPNAPLAVSLEPLPWPSNGDARPRRAAVSSFGFGGSNFHMIIEAGPAPRPPVPDLIRARAAQVLGRPLTAPDSLAELSPMQRLELVARLRADLGISRDAGAPLGVDTVAELAARLADSHAAQPVEERTP